MTQLKPFLEDMLSMSTGTDGRTLQIQFSRPVTKEDRQAFADAHNAIVRGQLLPPAEADQALIDKYRDPKTGRFEFPGDVAKIIRKLEGDLYNAHLLRDSLMRDLETVRGRSGQ